MNAAKHVLLIGASGFIGRAVLDRLLAGSDSSKISVLCHRRKITKPGIQVYQGSLQDFDWWKLNQHPPTTIIHLGRINATRFGKWGRRWAAWQGARANKRLLKHIERYGWNSQVSYVSGSLMYGDHGNDPVYVDSPLRPISFAREYIKAETPLLKYPRIQMIRLPWVIGNGSWFRDFYLSPIKNEGKVPCYGSGANRMSFIEVNDAGKAIVSIAEMGNPGVFHVAMEKSLSQNDFCTLLSAHSGKPIKVIPTDMLKRQYETAIYEAFTSSIVLASNDRKIWENDLEFKEISDVLPAYFTKENVDKSL